MQTLEGLPIAVFGDGWGTSSAKVVVGTVGHTLDLDTAARLAHALVEACAGPPATAFVRSIVSRRGHVFTVDREPVGTGVRVLVARPQSARKALGGSALARRGEVPSAEPEAIFDLSSADAGELALELLRTAAGLPKHLTFAAWTDGAWLSERRRAGDLEAALAATVRAAAPGKRAAQLELLERVRTDLGGEPRCAEATLPELSHGDRDVGAIEDVEDFADELAELGCARAFALGLADEAIGAKVRRIRDWSAPEIALYAAGRDVARGIAARAAAR